MTGRSDLMPVVRHTDCLVAGAAGGGALAFGALMAGYFGYGALVWLMPLVILLPVVLLHVELRWNVDRDRTPPAGFEWTLTSLGTAIPVGFMMLSFVGVIGR